MLFMFNTQAQDSNFYLGVSAGYASPDGDSMDGVEPGIDLGFAHLGYRFSESWGVVANLNSSGHTLEDFDDAALGVAYIGVGPMYTISVSDNMILDIKPQMAISMAGKFEGMGDGDDVTFRGDGLVFGTSLVMGSGSGVAFSLNLDYLSAKWKEVEYAGETVDYDDFSNDDAITQFKIGAGVRYNF